MLTKKEAISVGVIALILGFLLSVRNFGFFPLALLLVLLTICANIAAKKIVGYYYESEIEAKIWETYRYGLFSAISKGFFAHPSKEFKRPIQLGAIVPLVFSAMTFGYFTWFGSLTFDVKAKISRAAKRHGLYSFSEMTEAHMGYIAAAGIFINLILAVAGYLTGYSAFAEINAYYAFFNMIPISELDGNKIFFGNIVLWSFLAALSVLGLVGIFFVV